MKAHSTIFLKIKGRPSGGAQGAKAAAHVRYIGRWTACRLDVAREADQAHVGYMGGRPRSHGLFDADPGHVPDAGAVRAEVRATSGPTWRLVVSLREDDARTLGYTNLAAWQDLTRRYMARYAQALGIDRENLRWVAAHHPESGHPHVHVLVWMREGSREHTLTARELRQVRRAMAREAFQPLRVDPEALRTAARDYAIDFARRQVWRARESVRGPETEAQQARRVAREAERDAATAKRLREREAKETPAQRRARLAVQAEHPPDGSLPPRFGGREIDQLGTQIQGLAARMPGHGRAALAYMPAEIADEARAIARRVMDRPELARTLGQWAQATRELAAVYSRQPGADAEPLARGLADLRDRIAQAVVQAAADLNFEAARAAQRALSPAQAVAETAGRQAGPQEQARIAALLRDLQVEQAPGDAGGLWRAADPAALERAVEAVAGPVPDLPSDQALAGIVAAQIDRLREQWLADGERARGSRGSGNEDTGWRDDGTEVSQYDAGALPAGWGGEGATPTQAAVHDSGATLDREGQGQLTRLLATAAQRGDDGAPTAEAVAAGREAVALLRSGAQATRDAARAKVGREIVHQAQRLQETEAADRRWAARGAAQGVLHAAHGALQREYARSTAKAEMAREREAERSEREAQNSTEEQPRRRRGHGMGR